jgi:hypothetical protein
MITANGDWRFFGSRGPSSSQRTIQVISLPRKTSAFDPHAGLEVAIVNDPGNVPGIVNEREPGHDDAKTVDSAHNCQPRRGHDEVNLGEITTDLSFPVGEPVDGVIQAAYTKITGLNNGTLVLAGVD